MTNVLIPTDFSQNAWNAIKYGLQFFSAEPANFYLLHVSLLERQGADDSVTANGITFDLTHAKGIAKSLEVVKKQIEENFPNTNHQFFALHEHSFFIEGIKKVVSQRRIDFILMGTKGASGLKEVTIGSRTGEVITRVKCPTLVIPENAQYQPLKEIVLPTDFNLQFRNKILLTLAEIMAIHQSNLRILHVSKTERELSPSQQENKVFLEDFLEDKPHSFYFVTHPILEDSVQTFVEKHGINMIAMVAKNINFFQRLLFKPAVARISYHINIPFLVLHE